MLPCFLTFHEAPFTEYNRLYRVNGVSVFIVAAWYAETYRLLFLQRAAVLALQALY